MNTNPLIPIASLLLLALAGCVDSNIVDPFDVKGGDISELGITLKIDVKDPLSVPSVVEYTVITDKAEKKNEVMFVVLKNADSETPKNSVHRVEVEMHDDSSFSVTIPVRTFPGYSTEYFRSDKLFGGKKLWMSGILKNLSEPNFSEATEDDPVSEPEEN